MFGQTGESACVQVRRCLWLAGNQRRCEKKLYHHQLLVITVHTVRVSSLAGGRVQHFLVADLIFPSTLVIHFFLFFVLILHYACLTSKHFLLFCGTINVQYLLFIFLSEWESRLRGYSQWKLQLAMPRGTLQSRLTQHSREHSWFLPAAAASGSPRRAMTCRGLGQC